MKSPRAFAYLAFAIVCVVWGTTYLAIRIAIETIPPLFLTSARFTIAGIVLLTVAIARGERVPRDRRTLGNLALVGFLMLGIGNLAVVIAEKWVPSGMAALFVATAPFWMAIIERVRHDGEHLAPRRVLGLIIGFLGVAMLVTPGSQGGHFDTKFLLGALAIQVGSAAWQLGSVRSKYHLAGLPLLTSSALQMLFGGVMIGVTSVAIGELPLLRFTMRTFLAAAYLTVFGSIIAYSAYIYALSKLRTSTTSLYAYVNPVVAVFLGWLILDERLTWVSIAAMVTILAGVAIVQTGPKTKAAALPVSEAAEKHAA